MTLPLAPTNTSSKPSLYEQLVRISQEAFAGGAYDVAYHSLAAAMHSAVDSKKAGELQQIQIIAREQIKRIDLDSPDYGHSSVSSEYRGNKGIWLMLIDQASTREHMLSRHGGAPDESPNL